MSTSEAIFRSGRRGCVVRGGSERDCGIKEIMKPVFAFSGVAYGSPGMG